MALTNREQLMYEEILEWKGRLSTYERTDIETIYEKLISGGISYIPEDTQKELYETLDSVLFHLHAMIQGAQLQKEASDRILASARLFDEEITGIEDLKGLSVDQIEYIVKQQISRHRAYSFTQGGMSGMGGVPLLLSDLPAMLFINLRLVQLIALSYGYEVNTPKEMMISLKAFYTGTLPERYQMAGLEDLLADASETGQSYFYEGKEEITNAEWFEQPLRLMAKYTAIQMFKNRKIQGLPIVSMMIGAGSNYSLTKKVSDFAHHFYKYRYLMEKEGMQ